MYVFLHSSCLLSISICHLTNPWGGVTYKIAVPFIFLSLLSWWEWLGNSMACPSLAILPNQVF